MIVQISVDVEIDEELYDAFDLEQHVVDLINRNNDGYGVIGSSQPCSWQTQEKYENNDQSWEYAFNAS